MLPEMTGRAVSEQELDSVGLPSIDLESLEPFLFSATIPLRPDVDLGKYQDIRKVYALDIKVLEKINLNGTKRRTLLTTRKSLPRTRRSTNSSPKR